MAIVLTGLLIVYTYLPWSGENIYTDLIVRIRKEQTPKSLNPLMYFETETLKLSEIGFAISECLFDGLWNRTYHNGRIDYEKGLASSLSSFDNRKISKRWTVTLNNFYWNNTNNRVTAEDVLHTYKCIDLGGSSSPWRARLRNNIGENPHIQNSNLYKIEFVFRRPLTEGEVIKLLSFKIIPKDFEYKGSRIQLHPIQMRTKDSDNWHIFENLLLGTGPYQFSKEKSSEEKIVLERNTTNYKNANLPEHIIFKELDDSEIELAFGKSINFSLYIPNDYYDEIVSHSNLKTQQYTPFYFYALVFGQKVSDSIKKSFVADLNPDIKCDLLKRFDKKNCNCQYVNHGPFPWNWRIFVDYDRMPYTNEASYQTTSSHQKTSIQMIWNRNDTRTKNLAYLISDFMDHNYNFEMKELPEYKFMETLRSQNYDVALIVWEGFDQDYSISKLYTPKRNNELNIANLSRGVQKQLNREFETYMNSNSIDDKYLYGHVIHQLINQEHPYVYLFSPPRTAAFIDQIDGIDQYPVHPESFLANISKWRMR